MVKSLCRTLTRVSSHLKSAIYQGFQTINDYVTRIFSYFKYFARKAFTKTLNTATRLIKWLVSFFYDIYPDNQNKGFLVKILLDFIFDMIASQLCGVRLTN